LPCTVPTVGATPAPPPITGKLAVSTAELAHAVELEKYGIPPDVPATVRANVPLVVIGEPATEIRPPVNDCATLVTVPPPPAAVQVKVPLPLFVSTPLAFAGQPTIPVVGGSPVALVSVPLDGVPRTPPLTTNAPALPTFTPSAVRTPVPVVVVAGAAPAPPPIIKAFAVSSRDDAQVELDEK